MLPKNRFLFTESGTFIAAAFLFATLLLPETVYAIQEYNAEIPGSDQVRVVDSPSPAFLTYRLEAINTWGDEVVGQATRQDIAAASYGTVRGSSNADYLNVREGFPIVSGSGANAQESSRFFLNGDLVITGPPGNIVVSFNYFISGSIGATIESTGPTAYYQSSAGASATMNLGSSFGAAGYELGNMHVSAADDLQRTGIFSTFPVNSEGTAMFTTPAITTFAGDTALRFGLGLATGANVAVGHGAGAGRANGHASFTFGFPTSGPAANLPEGYTLNSVSGHIVNNQFVAPDPAGDYNGDGIIDAADYVLWRKTDGTQSGYNSWRAHFGQSVGSGAGAIDASNAVPEPTLIVLLSLVPFVGLASRHRHAPPPTSASLGGHPGAWSERRRRPI